MLDPRHLCRQHLLGEHRELHGLLRPPAGWSDDRWRAKLRGHLALRQIEPAAIVQRHADLVAEMERRGYRHGTPLDDAGALPGLLDEGERAVTVDRRRSVIDLLAKAQAGTCGGGSCCDGRRKG